MRFLTFFLTYKFKTEAYLMNCKKCGNKVYAKEMCNCGEKAPNPHKIAVSVNTVICSFFLILVTIGIILSYTLKNVVESNLIVRTIEQTELSSIEITIDDEVKNLDQIIYDEFIQDNSDYIEFIDSDQITLENVDNVLNAPFIKEFLIEKINGYQNFFMNKGGMEHITSDDIVNLIYDNKEILYNETGLEFEESDRQSLKNDLSSLDEFSDFCDDYLTGWLTGGFIKLHFSNAYLIFLAAFMLVILVQWIAVYIFNGRRVYKALRKYSIIVMIPSVLFFFISMYDILYNDVSIVGNLASKISSLSLSASIVTFALGFIMYVISMFLSKNAEKKALNVNADITENENSEADTDLNEDSKSIDKEEVKAEENKFFTPVNEDEYKIFAPDSDKENKESDASSDEDTKSEIASDNIEIKPKDEENSQANEIDNEENSHDENDENNLNSNVCICPSCGQSNEKDSLFCANCGNKIS